MSVVISIDAMGGDHAPSVVIDGIALSAVRHPDVKFKIFGRGNDVMPYLEKKTSLKDKYEFIHCDDIVPMDAKPAQVLRRSKQTSMWNMIGAVLEGTAHAAVSAGNTGALMAMSKLRLRMIDGISRPAIASLWPTRSGEAVMLDMGANVEATSDQLVEFAVMGAEYARILFDKKRPTIGILNVGTEAGKGNDVVKNADHFLKEHRDHIHFEYHGFVEGNDITKGTTDVIVTDGFTGNVALKTAEGTAQLIGGYLKAAILSNIWSKIGAWFARHSLAAFKEKIDPKRVNGGVFLGLSGLVVKSHGGTNALGFAAATDLSIDLAKGNIVEAIAKNITDARFF
ncbi:MAG: phosphate acyltransferase PlsX [Pseudomonadota bacterium]